MAAQPDLGRPQIAVETAVANASRILPLVTSAHLPSASNHSFWPEMYTNMPIVRGSEPSPYSDTPEPRCFGDGEPARSAAFSQRLKSTRGRDGLAARIPSTRRLKWRSGWRIARRRRAMRWMRPQQDSGAAFGCFSPHRSGRADPDWAGMVFRIEAARRRVVLSFQQSQEAEAGRKALDQYRMAREAWAGMAAQGRCRIPSDVTYGSTPMRRGHWSDRLARSTRILRAVAEQVRSVGSSDVSSLDTRQAIAEAQRQARAGTESRAITSRRRALSPGRRWRSRSRFWWRMRRASVGLHYRHVDQAERWTAGRDAGRAGDFTADNSGRVHEVRFSAGVLFRSDGQEWRGDGWSRRSMRRSRVSRITR